ncbi:radical SAM protein [Blautia schinkii]|nr:radical SAM protein [uncultured Blautia sp.]MDC7290871.1 radical SAM protein [Blautia schinkii]
MRSEYKSFYKQVKGNEGDKCQYSVRLDTYGCGCQHNCDYCYARSLLSFRGFWNPSEPSIADIAKIKRKIQKIPQGTIIRMGGMTDCFQPFEAEHRVTYETIREMNRCGIGYLIVTKSHMIAQPEYMEILDKRLAHIQITVTTLDDARALTYEKASIPTKRIEAIRKLQDEGYDVSIRLSPLIEEFMDFNMLNSLGINRCVVEFLRVNSWIKGWLKDVDFSRYNLKQGGYVHLPLEDKLEILKRIKIPEVTVCEDVTEHYRYWQENINPNKQDCCNLRVYSG